MEYPIIYTEINIFCIFIVILVMVKSLGVTQMTSARQFIKALAYMLAFMISDNIAFLMISGLIPSSGLAIIVFKSLYFMSTTLMCYYWFLYFESLRLTTFATSNKSKMIAGIPAYIQLVMTLVNIGYGFFFYMDNGVYHRGSLFALQYLFAYVYVGIAIYRALSGALKEPNYIDKNRVITLALFPIPPAVAGILQFFMPSMPVACAALTFSMLMLYFNFLENSISLDPLTRLSNRRELMWHLARRMKSQSEKSTLLYLMMIDANFFKSINDTYGHVEGDAALVRISDAMKKSLTDSKKKPLLARYGGDEFTVILEVESEDDIEAAASAIKEELKKLNDKAKSPYDLTLSIGIAAWNDSIKNVREFIALADEKLYEEKQLHHMGR